MWLAWFVRARTWRRGAAILIVWIGSSLLLAPVLSRYATVHQELRLSRPLDEIRRFSATPASFAHPAPTLAFWRSSPGVTEEDYLFPGVTAPIVAVACDSATDPGGGPDPGPGDVEVVASVDIVVDLDPAERDIVRRSGIRHGLCLVIPMHITAAVYVNDDEGGLIADIDDWLERLAPHEPTEQYRHNVGEDNADAHLKRHLMSHQVVLPITDGRLDLGPWEQVFYAEFDGRRRKRVVLKAIGE